MPETPNLTFDPDAEIAEAERPAPMPKRTSPTPVSCWKGYCAEFDLVGTRDSSAWLALGAALDWYQAMGGANLARRNQELARSMGQRLAEAFGKEVAGPPAMQGSMAAIGLPATPPGAPQARARPGGTSRRTTRCGGLGQRDRGRQPAPGPGGHL